jgi:predicted phosphoadenosine phosphosulfate sulfurtransferase
MSNKRPLGIDVLTAARQRIAWTFEQFNHIYVAFSGGKDSTVMLHLVMDEAKRRNRKVACVFIDLEGQYKLTVDHLKAMYETYDEWIDPYWVALPLHLRNAVSQYEPFWMCWDPDARDAWIRTPPDYAITDESHWPWFHRGMEFEEFVPAFGEWFGGEEECAGFVGIRTDESLNRWRTIANTHKATYDGRMWTTRVGDSSVNIYPVYDWRTEDIWTYHAKFPDHEPNPVYEMMYRAGLTVHQSRLCQPYGDDQKRGLWLYHLLEPETWARVVARVNGANQGAMYSNETGNISGYRRISKPDHHTWQSFAGLLLASMPDRTREHFENKILLHVKWWLERGYEDGIPDEAPPELETNRSVPSWRRVCKALLRNDYWAKGLGFTQHKSRAYAQYLDLMKRRRADSAYSDANQQVKMALDLGAANDPVSIV